MWVYSMQFIQVGQLHWTTVQTVFAACAASYADFCIKQISS